MCAIGFGTEFPGLGADIGNDGSTDQSPTLCEEWAKKGTRIRVIHKANGGLSDARNAGLLEAKGEYIHFLDGDDYYTSDNVLQTLMEQVDLYQHPDTLLFCRIDRYDDTGKDNKERPYNTDFINQASSITIIFEHLLRTQRFNMSACFQILRREFLMDNQIFFEKGLLSEDVDWSMALWQHLKTVKAVNCYGYCYRHRSASISTSLSVRTYRSYQYMFQKWIPRLQKDGGTLAQLQLNYLAFLFPTLLYAFFSVPKQDRVPVYELLKKMKSILQYSVTKKSDRVAICVKIIGFYLTCRIFASYGCISKRGVNVYMKVLFGQ